MKYTSIVDNYRISVSAVSNRHLPDEFFRRLGNHAFTAYIGGWGDSVCEIEYDAPTTHITALVFIEKLAD